MTKDAALQNLLSKCTEEEILLLEELATKTAAPAVEVPWYQDEAFIAKLASEYSTEEIAKMAEQAVKEDQLAKIAADYDAAGRIMARGYIDELKQAGILTPAQPVEETKTAASREEKLALLKTLL